MHLYAKYKGGTAAPQLCKLNATILFATETATVNVPLSLSSRYLLSPASSSPLLSHAHSQLPLSYRATPSCPTLTSGTTSFGGVLHLDPLKDLQYAFSGIFCCSRAR